MRIFSDVSGGASYSILNEMRSVLQVSNSLSMMKDNYTQLSYKNVFHMATLGGAKGTFFIVAYWEQSFCISYNTINFALCMFLALSVEDKLGNLMPGKEFDALIIDLNAEGSLLDNFREYTLEEKLQRFIYSGDDRNVISVYIKGRKVK